MVMRRGADAARRASASSGQSKGQCSAVSAEPDVGEHPLDDRDVAFGAGVARAGQHELLVVELDPGREHRRGLQQLERGTRVDQGVGVAERGLHAAIRADQHGRAEVTRLDHARAFEHGELDRAGGGQNVSHQLQSVANASSSTPKASRMSSSLSARLGRKRSTLP